MYYNNHLESQIVNDRFTEMERLLIIFYIALSLLFTSSSAFLYNHGLSLPDVQAEKLIRELNLEVNADKGYEFLSLAGTGKRLFERKFKFPNLVEESGDGVSVADLGHHTGYYKLSYTHDARMFYFFESRNSKKDPVVTWLSGGPGCSNSLVLFYEKCILEYKVVYLHLRKKLNDNKLERYTMGRQRFSDRLETIKSICKDFWSELFKKQIDNLKTNH